jgi:hypothetical protein
MSKKVEVDLTDTLMMWAGEYHLQSDHRHRTYYLSVPDAWADLSSAELKANVFGVFSDVYDDFNAHFRLVEPDDLSYLSPIDVAPRILTPEEEKVAPWLNAPTPSPWERTPCIVVDDQDKYTKVERNDF